MFERSEFARDPGWTEHRRKVIGVRHRFRRGAFAPHPQGEP